MSTAPRGSGTLRAAEMGCPRSRRLITLPFSAPHTLEEVQGHRRQADHRRRGPCDAGDAPHRQDAHVVGTSARCGPTTSPAGGAYTHMTMLATDNASMANLFTMSSLASLTRSTPNGPASTVGCSTATAGMIATTSSSGEIQHACGWVQRPGPGGSGGVPRHLRRRTTSSSSWTTATASSSAPARTPCGWPRT